jgi:hypothetical protein
MLLTKTIVEKNKKCTMTWNIFVNQKWSKLWKPKGHSPYNSTMTTGCLTINGVWIYNNRQTHRTGWHRSMCSKKMQFTTHIQDIEILKNRIAEEVLEMRFDQRPLTK